MINRAKNTVAMERICRRVVRVFPVGGGAAAGGGGGRGVCFVAGVGCEGEHCEGGDEGSGLVLHLLLMLRGFY